jgi:dihydrofolate reductase
MARTTVDISMSLDGFIAGPNPTVDEPLGAGGEQLHEWIFGLASWRERHGEEGGAENADSELVRESVDATGAVVMGRRMFSGGQGPWESDPVAGGWWGDEPPFGVPVFVLTHHAREPLELQGKTAFSFVTDGVDGAHEQARAAAGGKNVAVAGGADVVQQFLDAGLLDELQIHLVPVLLGDGVRLFDGPRGTPPPAIELTRVVDSPSVTHLRYRVTN